MNAAGYCPNMDVPRGVTTGLDAVFGLVRVTVDETLVVVVAEHTAHPHDILAAGAYARELSAGREPCGFYADTAGTKDALIQVYPRMPSAFDLKAPARLVTGVPV